MNAILQDLPLPARLVPWPRASPTTLTRCLVLALLLHLWLVLWLGNAPGGTAPPGRGVFGAINVTLRGPETAGETAVAVPPTPASIKPGDAPAPRWGGAVRSVEPEPDSLPGAARLGEQASRPPARSRPVPVPAPEPVPEPVVEPVPREVSTLAAPERVATVPVLTPAPNPTMPPAVVSTPTPPVPVAPSLTPPLAPEPPLPAPPPPERVLDARRLSAPAPVQSVESLPSITALPLPDALALPTVPTPSAVVAAPSALRQLASPLSEAAALAPSVPLARPDLPMVAPAAAVLPTLAETPAPLRQLRQLQSRSWPARTPQPALTTSGEAPPIDLSTPAAVPGVAVAPARVGAADAGAQVGRDVATPPSAAASAVPRLNLQLARPRGGELSRYGSTGVLPVLPRPPERDDKLAREIEQAARTDCRQAYRGMGPLAVIPLALDAVRQGGGCKW